MLLTDAASAEMAKLVENAYRDVNIAFANELSLICERLRLDVWEVIKLANHHPRVNILTPGPGRRRATASRSTRGSSSASAPELARLIRTAREVNDSKPHHVAPAGHRPRPAGSTRRPSPASGSAFKANVDDLRESPAVEIVAQIAEALPDVDVLAAGAVRRAAAGRAGRQWPTSG